MVARFQHMYCTYCGRSIYYKPAQLQCSQMQAIVSISSCVQCWRTLSMYVISQALQGLPHRQCASWSLSCDDYSLFRELASMDARCQQSVSAARYCTEDVTCMCSSTSPRQYDSGSKLLWQPGMQAARQHEVFQTWPWCVWLQVSGWRKQLDVAQDKPETYVVSQYLDQPLLLGGRKFDLRIYVLVLSYVPLVVYLHR